MTDAAVLRHETVAIKRMAFPSTDAELTRLCREVNLMRGLTHPNLLTILGVCASNDSLTIITELMTRGSIYHWLHKDCRGVPPPLTYALRMLIDTAAALAHLHTRSPRVAHRDLKTLNLLLAADYSVRVADFGLSREFAHTQPMSRVGTVQYAAPEVLLGKAYSHKCDVWSFGIVCWEMCTGLVPFVGLSSEDVARKVAVEGLRLPPPANAPMPLLQIMAKCWWQPAKRPDLAVVHKQLSGLLLEQRAAAGAGIS